MFGTHRKTIFETLGRHPIHPFPARMAPEIALDALGESNAPLRVLDPMVGSGTVLAVARSKGHHAVGVDLDPLAVLLAGVWTRTVEADRAREKAAQVLDRAKRSFADLSAGAAYPNDADDETRAFIRYWFDEYSRRQLAALSGPIGRVRHKPTRDALWCLLRLIITKQAGASLAMDLSHSRPHRYFNRAPVKPFARFLAAVEAVVSNCPDHAKGCVGPVSVVRRGDARKLEIDSRSIDLVLTSPPYLNAIDYMRCSKFSLVWMGYTVRQIRGIRGESVGAESSLQEALAADWVKALMKQLKLSPALSQRDHGLLARYVWAMSQVLSETSRVLRHGGRAVYVVGDCRNRSTYVRNSMIVRTLAERHGLPFVSCQSRSLPANRRYMPPPKRMARRDKMDGRMRREVVLVFRRP